MSGLVAGINRRMSVLRSQIRTRWLRFVKAATAISTGTNSALGLEVLARMPSGWPAHIELSERYLEADPQRALKHAELAIVGNSTVYQGHLQRVKTLDSMGCGEDSRRARAVGSLVMSPSSFSRAARTWFPEDGALDLPGALDRLALPPDQAPAVAEEIIRLVGPRNALIPLKRFVDYFGGRALEAADACHLLTVDDLVSIARRLREAGEVAVPLRMVEAAPTTDLTARLRLSWSQDVRALEGVLTLPEREQRVVEPKLCRGMYLLHNSLPHRSAGYAIRSHGLLTGLSKLGWDMMAVTRPGFPPRSKVFDQDPNTPAQEAIDGVIYHRLVGEVETFPRSDFRAFTNQYVDALEPLIKEHRPEVIHAASNWWNGLAAVQAAREIGVPSVYEIRGLWEITRASRQEGWSSTERYRADSEYETMTANLADGVITITLGLKEEMIRRGVPAEKIHVVPNSVDPSKFLPAKRDEALAARLGIRPDDVVVGFAGTLTFYEGLDDLAAAASLLRSRGAPPFRLLFVGDGPVLSDLREAVSRSEVADKTIFAGRVHHSEVAAYLSLMDITPFPRKPTPVTELVSPLKPLESMATGTAVLASDVQALSEMIPEDGGVLFRKGDVEDLARQLGRLIEDSELRDRLAENGRRWVLAERTWERGAERIVAIYAELGVEGAVRLEEGRV